MCRFDFRHCRLARAPWEPHQGGSGSTLVRLDSPISENTSRQIVRFVVGQNMNAKLHLARILGAAVILIALIIAPSMASAHVVQGGHAGSMPTAPQVASDTKPAPDQAALKASPAELRSTTESHSPSSTSGCQGRTCCSGAPCTACCAVAVPEVPASTPPTASVALILPGESVGASIHPTGLRRPPRFFA